MQYIHDSMGSRVANWTRAVDIFAIKLYYSGFNLMFLLKILILSVHTFTDLNVEHSLKL